MLKPLGNMEGDRSPPFAMGIFYLKICSEDLKIFYFGDFSIEVLKIFNEYFFIGDFFLKIWDFFLKNYLGDLSFEDLKKI